MTDERRDAALRALDPAPATTLTADEQARAEETFARVVATPVPSRQRTRRRWRLPAALGLGGAAGAAGLILLLGGSGAYGSWSPTPEALGAADARAAAATCRAFNAVPDEQGDAAIAESRGGWTYVLLTGDDLETACLMSDDLLGTTSGDRGLFSGSHDTDPPPPPTIAPNAIVQMESTEGSTDEGWFASVEGHVGRDVAGVTVHTSSGLDVEASVANGRFAAWWPAEPQSSTRASETWSYTVHLADGSSRRVD